MLSSIIDFIFGNTTMVMCIVIFLICVFIGFLGDRRFKKNNVLGNLLEKSEEEIKEVTQVSLDSNVQKDEIVESKIEEAVSNLSQNASNVDITSQEQTSMSSLDFVQTQDEIQNNAQYVEPVQSEFENSSALSDSNLSERASDDGFSGLMENGFENNVNMYNNIIEPTVDESFATNNVSSSTNETTIPQDLILPSDDSINNMF